MNQHRNSAGAAAPDPAPARGVRLSQQSADLVWGAQAIADDIGRDVRAVYHLAASGALPIHKKGGRLVASRAQLRAAIVGESA
jgi:hypothetical protein